MKIGVLSDTHNNEANTLRALEVFRQHSITQLIHCGDVTRPPILELFGGFEMWLVWGNNDQDLSGLRTAARRIGTIHCMGYDAVLEFDGHRVGVCHGDDEDRVAGLTHSGLCEWVFVGHSHVHRLEKIKPRVSLLNPGALGGRNPEPRGVAIVDLAQATAQFLQV